MSRTIPPSARPIRIVRSVADGTKVVDPDAAQRAVDELHTRIARLEEAVRALLTDAEE